MELLPKLLFRPISRLLSRLFPSRCILCCQTIAGPAAHDVIEICTACFSLLPFNETSCLRCALPLADDMAEQLLCGRCIQKSPGFDYSYSVFHYEDDIISMIHKLKFSEKITYARSIGEILAKKLADELPAAGEKPDCILPVPLHKKRMRQRGFNQSIEIARGIAAKYKIPIEANAVVRQQSTSSQTGLNAKQRRKNIKGAFCVAGKLNYKHVLIIDDVVTTGSTVNELAKLLKKNKVERVGVLSIARAPVRN